MRQLIVAEFRRLLATRLWWIALLAATGLGGGLVGCLALVGPEHFSPPMPGLHSAAGARLVLGILGYTAFVPAAFGTLAVTSEYRHRTVDVTFLFAPSRWRVLTAKLAVFAVGGLCYGAVLAGTAAVGLYAGAAGHGSTVGVPVGAVAGLLGRLAVAMAVYTLLGVGVGALVGNQVAALCLVIGYLYLGEPVLMMIPGANAAYPLLPGGATAALTGFHEVSDAMAAQLPTTAIHLVSPVVGALVLLGYTLVAAAVAVFAPLRRDLA